MQGMRRLQEAGVVRHVGVSNFSLARGRRRSGTLGQPVLSNQVQYSLAARKPERELVPLRPGRTSGSSSPTARWPRACCRRYDGTNTPGGVRAGNALFLPENIERAKPCSTPCARSPAAHDATPAQVALAWVIRRPNVVAIPGASSVAQLESNAAAADLELTDEEDARLTEASADFEPVGGLAARRAAEGVLPSDELPSVSLLPERWDK